MSCRFFLLVLSASGIHVANSQCNPGSTGPVNGDCLPCEAGTYLYKEHDDSFQNLLRTNTPYIVSDAKDWNTTTQRFDSICGNQTCQGNTGALGAGVVATGMIQNNGARIPVAFVGGNTASRMQWGPGSIPAAFTICSVTRYSGGARGRILNAQSNPAGSRNWLHGHYGRKTGVNFYDGWIHGSQNFALDAITDWVAMCASNSPNTNGLGKIVNGIITSDGRGGMGSCALGINHNQASDWQLSKVYVWNTHLSDEDLTLASLSLHSALFSDTTVAGVCLPCQANSQSQPGASVCGCSAGYTAENGWLCRACAANSFKSEVGFMSCTLCPANAESPAASVIETSCRCKSGYFGLDGEVCGICPANSRSLTPSADITSCTCNANYYGVNGNICTVCPANSQSVIGNVNISGCICRANYHGTNGVCAQCPTNSQSVAGKVDATGCMCNQNYYGTNGVCSLCPANSRSVVGAQAITDCFCNPGYFGENGGLCSIPVCPAGKYSSAPDHTVCNANAAVATGSHQQCAQNSDCNYPTCNRVGSNHGCYWNGFWAGGSWWNNKCWPGSNIWSAANKQHFCRTPPPCIDGCYECPRNTNSNTGSNHMIDCTCNAGSTGRDGVACTLCPAGTYKDTTGSAACSVCRGNSSSVAGSIAFDACVCNAGFSGGDGQTCTECAIGKYKSSIGNANCDNCESGSTLSAAATSVDMCVQCQPNARPITGMYNNYSVGFENCNCMPGYSHANSGDACVACDVGKFKDESGSAECMSCPDNSEALGVANKDCLCNVGYYGPGTAACTACGVNSFKNTMGTAECTTCPFEQFAGVASTSVSDCSGCAAGKYVSHVIFQAEMSEYASGCSAVDIRGRFNDTDTMWETYPMYKHVTQELFMYYKPPNTENANWGYVLGQHPSSNVLPHAYSAATNMSTGATKWFQQCLTGPSKGQWLKLSDTIARPVDFACSDCIIGKFSNTSDAPECTSCDASSYTDMPGMPACKICPTPLCQCSAGFTGEFGWLCEACTENTFKSSVGSAACTLCPENAASPAASTLDTNCSCNADYFGKDGGECTACPANSFSAPGSTINANCSCKPGYLNLESDNICSYCSAGSYFAKDNNNITICRCMSGFFGPDGGECTALARPGSFVTRYTYNPGTNMRSYSSRYLNFNYPQLGSWTSWRPNTNPSWIQIDTGVITSVLGVITEGRGGWAGFWVDLYRVSYSEVNSGPFIEYPMHFHGGQARRTNLLLPYVRARYIRIHPLKWTTKFPHLQAGLFIEGSSVCNLGEISAGNITSADECSRCPSGTYNDVRGAEMCTPCAVDTFSGPNAVVCISCVANSNSNSSARRTMCLCNPGWTAAQTAAGSNKECEQCAAGKFKHTTGDAPCSECDNVKIIDDVLTCVDVVSFRLFLTELSEIQHVDLQNSIARQFGLPASMVEIRVATAVGRRLLSEPFAIDVIVSVPNDDASGASTPLIPSMQNVYQGLAADQFVSAVMLIDGSTNAVHLTEMFEIDTPLRTVLNSNIGASWSVGDKVVVYANGQRALNDIVLTYMGENAASNWSPVNCEPLLESSSSYVFFLQNGHINLYPQM